MSRARNTLYRNTKVYFRFHRTILMNLHVQTPFWITRPKLTLWVCSFLGNMACCKPETQLTWKPSTKRIAQNEKIEDGTNIKTVIRSQRGKITGHQPEHPKNMTTILLPLISKHFNIYYFDHFTTATVL